MRKFSLFVVTAILVLTGCKPKEVSKSEKMEAAALSSEASFALQVREYARAEELMQRAVKLNPEDNELWLQLGVSQVRLNKRSDAKKAYKKALSLQESVAKKNSKDTEFVIRQIHTLVLLGQPDDARKLMEKAGRDFPNDNQIQAFISGKILDKIIAEPGVKEISL